MFVPLLYAGLERPNEIVLAASANRRSGATSVNRSAVGMAAAPFLERQAGPAEVGHHRDRSPSAGELQGAGQRLPELDLLLFGKRGNEAGELALEEQREEVATHGALPRHAV